jgi:hypothetical protein
MRTIRAPLPRAVAQLFVEGPVLPFTANAAAALSKLDGVLAGVPGLDIELGPEGWTVVWRSHVFQKPASVEAWVWCARSARAAELAGLVARSLEAAGFRAVYKAARDADAGLEPRVVYLRSGGLRLGLDPRAAPMMEVVEVMEEDRADVDPGRSFRFGPQRCPGCGAVDNPAALVAGFPSADLLLAAELGEVAFIGCDPGDRRAGVNARCRRCSRDFRAR